MADSFSSLTSAIDCSTLLNLETSEKVLNSLNSCIKNFIFARMYPAVLNVLNLAIKGMRLLHAELLSKVRKEGEEENEGEGNDD